MTILKIPLHYMTRQIEKLKLFFSLSSFPDIFSEKYRDTIYKSTFFPHLSRGTGSKKFTCSGGIEFPPLSRQHDHSWAVLPGRYLILGTSHSCPPGSGVGLQPVSKSHYFYSPLQQRETIKILYYRF